MARYSNVKRVNGHLQKMPVVSNAKRSNVDTSEAATKMEKAKSDDEAKRKKAEFAVKSMRAKQWNPREAIRTMSPVKRRYQPKG